MKKKWLTFWLVASASLMGLQACGAGGIQSLFFSTDDEREIGNNFDAQLDTMLESGESRFVASTAADRALVAYFDSLGHMAIAGISDDEWESILPTGKTKSNFFTFQIIKSSQVNAFAVPGGYVYFYTSIFKEFQNESELVGVLSHEIGHIVLHHTRESLLKNAAYSTALDALLGEGSASGIVGQLGINLTLLSSSRENEFEADAKGVEYSRKAGVAPTGIETFFSRGVEWNGTNCVDPTGTSVLKVFSTHPPSCERIAAVKKQVSTADRAMPTNAEYYKSITTASGLSF